MTTNALDDLLRRAKDWPVDARSELQHLAAEIEAELGQGAYRASPEELAGIERGLRDSAQGNFANEAEVEAVLVKRRGE